MPLNDSEDIKKQTFDRILTTISRKKRKKRLLNGAILFFVLSICSASLYFFILVPLISPPKNLSIFMRILQLEISQFQGQGPFPLLNGRIIKTNLSKSVKRKIC